MGMVKRYLKIVMDIMEIILIINFKVKGHTSGSLELSIRENLLAGRGMVMEFGKQIKMG